MRAVQADANHLPPESGQFAADDFLRRVAAGDAVEIAEDGADGALPRSVQCHRDGPG